VVAAGAGRGGGGAGGGGGSSKGGGRGGEEEEGEEVEGDPKEEGEEEAATDMLPLPSSGANKVRLAPGVLPPPMLLLACRRRRCRRHGAPDARAALLHPSSAHQGQSHEPPRRPADGPRCALCTS